MIKMFVKNIILMLNNITIFFPFDQSKIRAVH